MRTKRIRGILALLMAGILFVAAPAAAQETERETPPEQQAPPIDPPMPQDPVIPEGQGVPGEELPGVVEGQGEMMPNMLSGAVLSDAEVLHIFRTANQGEIATSQPIGDGAEEEVRAYAQHMIDRHNEVLARLDSLAGAMGLQPQDNMVSATLNQIAQGVAGRLTQLDDPDHRDMQYMASQIALHQQTLDMLDFVLIPNAQDESLRNLLSQSRAAVMRHLEEAKKIHDGLD